MRHLQAAETLTAETDDKQKFDDDKATPVDKELEEFANKEGLSLDRAKEIMDYSKAIGISLDDAREEIESLFLLDKILHSTLNILQLLIS